MAETIGMPKLGLTMETGAVGTWLVSEGDKVKAGQRSPRSSPRRSPTTRGRDGRQVLKLLLEEEVDVPVGTPLVVIGPRRGRGLGRREAPRRTTRG